MFRLSPSELWALHQANLTLDASAKAWLFDSRTTLAARGGDVGILLLQDGNDDARFQASIRFSKQYFEHCEAKIDVVVFPCQGQTTEQQVFVQSLRRIPVDTILDAPRLDHVALLVEDLDPSRARCQTFGFPIQPVGDFPAEGTRECYVGEPGRPARLLLMQATGPGPYRRALEKRGPGLHHLGLHVRSQSRVVATMVAQGWRVHDRAPAWLVHSETRVLLELNEVPWQPVQRPLQAVVEETHVACRTPMEPFASGVFLDGGGSSWFCIGPEHYADSALASPAAQVVHTTQRGSE